MKLTEIEDRQAAIRSELAALDDAPETTEEDHGDLRDTLIYEYEQLDERKAPIVERMEKLKLIKRASGDTANREPGDDRDRRTPEFMTRLDPFADLDRVRDRMVPRADLVARSLTAIENHNKRGHLEADRAQEATRKAQWDPSIARHMLMTGSDEYVEAFRAYLADPEGEGGMLASRALTTPVASGGYMLPFILDNSIVLASSGSSNPYRRIARIETTTSNTWNGVTSAGVNASWLGEAAVAADASPTIGNIAIYPQKGSAWIAGSFEFRDDSTFASQLPSLLGDAKDRLEEATFASATGTTGTASNPKSALSTLGTGQKVVAASASGAFVGTGSAVDVYNLQAKLAPRWRQSSAVAWLANITNINKLRAIDVYGGSSFWANFGNDTPEQLLGKPIYESSSVTTATGTGTGTGNAALLFGDWNQYIIVDRVGSSMLYVPMLTGTGSGANLPTGQSGWFYFWRTGADVSTSSAFVYLANSST